MKLLYDAQIFLNQRSGGISRYHYELYDGLKKLGYDAIIAGRFVKNQYLLSNPEYKRLFIQDQTASFAFINKIQILKALTRMKPHHIFHPANPYPFLHDAITTIPHTIFTIHDMIAEDGNPESGMEKRHFANQADKIITVSETTKKDIIRHFSISPDKIEVIYHGSSLHSDNTRKPKEKIPEQYLLYIGDRNGHKNFLPFLKGISTLLLRKQELHLVCAGKKKFSNLELQVINELNIASKVHLFMKFSNQELAYLYANSMAFVFPSLKEGFGLPILEAWSCGTPVILSNNACFTEIAAEAGLYFNPEKPDELTEVVGQVLQDAPLRKELISKGEKRLELFSWEKSVQEHLKLYKSVI